MFEAVQDATLMRRARPRAPHVLVLISMLLLVTIYTCLTLYGSWDFLLNSRGVIRLTTATKAPISHNHVYSFGETVSLPDDWREAEQHSNAWRYAFVFELLNAPSVDQEVYLPRVGDNAKITINGVGQPHSGQIGVRPDLHWSVPLKYPVSADLFRVGRNELWVDVFANEPTLGSLLSVSVGPIGAFDAHQRATLMTNRGLAYVLLGIDVFAILAFVLYSAAITGRFYIVSAGVCVSLLGCLVPHVVNTPVYSVSQMFCGVIASFLLLQSCCVYLCTLFFPIARRTLLFVFTVNAINVVVHLSLPYFFSSYEDLVQVLVYPNILTQVTGMLVTVLLVKRFLQYGEAAVGIILLFATFMAALGVRDFLVVWGVLPSYQGFYSLHSVGVMVLCLVGLTILRIREGYIEQVRYRLTMREALTATRESIKKAGSVPQGQSLDALVSRIATTYSHEFRNPLAAALATNKILLMAPWSSNATVALRRIQRSIIRISDALNRQFDFHRALQSSDTQFIDAKIPGWLLFIKDFPSCKIVWLSDPSKMPKDPSHGIEKWLCPFLEKFEKVPSVCLIHHQNKEVILHLYLHLNASDTLQGRCIEEGLLPYLKPESVRDADDGKYLYWCHAFS